MKDLLFISIFVLAGMIYIYLCALITGIKPVEKKKGKPTFEQYLSEINGSIDNAEMSSDLLKIPSLINEFKKDHKNLEHVDWYAKIMMDAAAEKRQHMAAMENRRGVPYNALLTV